MTHAGVASYDELAKKVVRSANFELECADELLRIRKENRPPEPSPVVAALIGLAMEQSLVAGEEQ